LPLTARAAELKAAARDKRSGAIVESLNGAQIVVERAMYSNASGVVCAAGTTALATPGVAAAHELVSVSI
jgi:hypothetical protein